jgi:hypothetical protein
LFPFDKDKGAEKTKSKKYVINETYDEIVFVEPYPELEKIIDQFESKSIPDSWKQNLNGVWVQDVND